MKDGFNPKQQFLTPEISAKIISKGFSENCVGLHGGVYGIMFAGPVTFKDGHAFYGKSGAVLIQQAEDWFLDKHDWSIEIKSFYKRDKSKTRWWRYEVNKKEGVFLNLPEAVAFKTRREARLSAIEILLNYLPDRK